MANISLNGLSVVEARIQVPRLGNWTADLVVDAQTAAQVSVGAAGTLELANGQLSYLGTIYRVDSYSQTVLLRMVGGSNGLAALCRPRFYQGVTVAVPLADALSDAQETLSSSSDQASMASALTFWTQIQQPVGLELTSLAQAAAAKAVWRVLPDGTVFFGVDTFQPASLTDYELIHYLPQEGLQVIAAEVPDVFPGQSFGGGNVSVVEHIINADGSRTKIWLE